MTPHAREWVARARYPGKDEFWFGTVAAESEMEAERAAFALWATIMPIGPPAVFVMVPGILILQVGEDP